jgi:hypothetical protein
MENVESFIKLLIDVQDGSNVTASVAVVRSRPDGNEVLVFEPVLEAIHDKLMRSCDQGNVIDVIEFSCHFRAKQPTSSSRRHGPGLDVLWVRPHEIAEWTLMRNFHSSINESDLVNGFDFRRETTVNAEDLALNDSSDTEIVEYFSAVLPWVSVSVLSNGLIVESIDSSDLSCFVISSKESDMSWVFQLEAEQELECFDGVESSVDKISHENIASVWNFTALVEKFQKIVELSMDISTNGNRSFNWLNITFFDQNLFDLFAKDSKFSFWKNCSVFDGLEPLINVG